MRMLVTNDDGIACPGLHAMAAGLLDAGHEVIVVAPAHDCSGQSAAIRPLHQTGKIAFDRTEIAGLNARAIAVKGPPALAVMAGCLGGFGARPEVVVSGINAGANTGRAVLHSGTVAAALTARNLGVAALAVSQADGRPHVWESAATLGAMLVDGLDPTMPTVLSLNVPNLSAGEISGVVPAGLDPGGTVQATMIERTTGVLELHLPEPHRPTAGTDTALLESGYATLTALVGPSETGADLRALCAAVEDALDLFARDVPA